MPIMLAADRKLVDEFLDACEKLTLKQWKEICRRRAANKRRIKQADGVWGSLMFTARKNLPYTAADEKQDDIVNDRMDRIASRFPARPFEKEEATLRRLIMLAMAQGGMVRRTYHRCIGEPGAPEAARALTEDMEGCVPGLPAPKTKPRPAKKKEPELPAASKATEDAMTAALEAARASWNAPPRKMVASAKGAAPPPLAPVIAGRIGPGEEFAFFNALLDWATATDPLRAARVEDLPAIPRMIRVLYWFWADSQSEGIWYFISESWGSRFWRDLRDACKRIGATKTLGVLDRVDKLFPTGIPKTEEAMRAAMEAFDDLDVNPLEALDGKYGETIRTEIPRRLHGWLRAHSAQVERAHRL